MPSATRFRRRRLARAIALVCVAAPLGGFATDARAQDVDLGNLGTRGFRIDGIGASDYSGFSVSGAGDVNGDGLADLIVGAFGAGPGGDASAGESYVVFGKAGGAPVDLAALRQRAAFASTASTSTTTPVAASPAPATSTATASPT